MELCGLAALDVKRNTAYHLNAFQTVDLKEGESLLQFYARMLLQQKEALLKLSAYLVVDAYFSKETFVSPMRQSGFHIISRLRDDANLQYPFKGKQKPRGRKKLYDGKVDVNHLSDKHVKCVQKMEKERIYWFEAYSPSLKKMLNIVLVKTLNNKEKWQHKIYFSTDLTQEWQDILDYYRLRFQIEFLYRDAKQYTGLSDCQARSTNKLHFHWNMSLTAINLAKILHWVPLVDKQSNAAIPFSMRDVKTLYHNKLLLDLFIRKFGIDPELRKNRIKIEQILKFGRIAA